MVVGVNGAGKTTTIGKLTRYLAEADQKVLLAAADTFRARRARAARRCGRSATRSRSSARRAAIRPRCPSTPSAPAVRAACDVVMADTAGRLPTQMHLMEELKKIKRVIGKAQEGAPHEVLLVVDGNTGQNALAPGQGV